MLNCRYYGIECNFEIEGELNKIAQEMKKHTLREHGVDFTKEFLTQTILRKTP
jgi:predicted small metal-binding protein